VAHKPLRSDLNYAKWLILESLNIAICFMPCEKDVHFSISLAHITEKNMYISVS